MLKAVASGAMQLSIYYHQPSEMYIGHDFFKPGTFDHEALDERLASRQRYFGQEVIRIDVTPEEARQNEFLGLLPPAVR
jgi:hypothetical protein